MTFILVSPAYSLSSSFRSQRQVGVCLRAEARPSAAARVCVDSAVHTASVAVCVIWQSEEAPHGHQAHARGQTVTPDT